MKIKLKLSQEVAQSIGLSSYVISTAFDFSSALLQAVTTEGRFDHMDDDNAPWDATSSLNAPRFSPSPLSSAFSSPLSTPPASPTLPPRNLTPPPGASSSRKRKKHSKQHSKKNRQKKRAKALPKVADDIAARVDPVGRYVPTGLAVQASFSMQDDAPVASTSYVGTRDDRSVGEGRTWWLKEVTGNKSEHKFRLIKAVPGTTIPFADASGRIIVTVTYPDDPSIQACATEAAELLRDKRKEASFTNKQTSHRRGDFAALSAGVTHGNGRLQPGNLIHSEANANVLEDLLWSSPFQRLSGFATGVMKTWAPKLYEYCSDRFERLLASDDSLIRIFNNSVMSTAAFNFGPRTVCLPHIDYNNLPFLWCFIWALGWYDWRKGGHLILWDLGLVIEFPPGSLAAIPSGVCRHSNARVRNNELRYSFTQYSSGGNFRWVDRGFMSEEAYAAKMTAAEAKEERIRKEERWEMGLSLFSTVAELGLRT